MKQYIKALTRVSGGPSDPDQKTETLKVIRLSKSKSILLKSTIAMYQTYAIHKTKQNIRHDRQLLRSKLLWWTIRSKD